MLIFRVAVLATTVLFSFVQATSLRDSIEDTLNNNPSIIASHINKDAYLKYVEQEKGDYLPTIDLDGYVEKSKTYNNPDTPPPAKGWSDKDGWNLALKLQYILYDGGLTPSQVGEYQHKYNANRFKNMYDVENTIYDTITNYMDLEGSQELLALAVNNMNTHEKYLEIAKEKEAISGEVLETHQVNSKYHSVIDSYLDEEKKQYLAQNLYKKFVGHELKGNICRPVIDETFIPKNVKEAVEIGLRRSFQVNEQIENIKAQREKVVQERAGFLPTIKFELQGQWDDDLELEENGRQDIYRGRIYLNWNLYKGGKTVAATKKEELFLKEEQKKLDDVTAKVDEEINTAYYTYFNLKKRVANSEKIINDNYNILMVYKKQLADGTRTFIDILNAESELYRSDIAKIKQEMDLYNAYYDLLNKLSMLSNVILMQDKQVCPKYVFTPRKTDVKDPNEDTTISQDLKDMFASDNGSTNVDNNTDLNSQNMDSFDSDNTGLDQLSEDLNSADDNGSNDQTGTAEESTQEDSSSAVPDTNNIDNSNQNDVQKRLNKLYDQASQGNNGTSNNKVGQKNIELPAELNKKIEREIIQKKKEANKKVESKNIQEPVKIENKANQEAVQKQKELLKAPDKTPVEKEIPKADIGTKNFTINIATLHSQKELKAFIDEYKLQDGAYFYRFGKDKKKIKLLYGEYDTVAEAKAKIAQLPKGLKEYVYVDNLQKHMALKNKYNRTQKTLSDVITGKYTINIATVGDESELKKYIDEYKLKPTYSYRFGDGGKKIKLIYGSFETMEEAQKALDALPLGLRNYVYIDSVQKHMELENKYKMFN